jgi:hypothetical protein
MDRPVRVHRIAAPWLLLAGLLLLVSGFAASELLEALPRERARELLLMALAGLLLAAPVLLLRWRLADGLALVVLAAHMAFAGPVALACALALVAVALVVGDLVARPARAGAAVALVAGLALMAAAVGWLLPLKLHRDWIYALLIGGILVARRAVLARQIGELARQWRHAVAQAPRMATLAVLALALAATPGWLPTLQFDDLTYHLGLPAQLQQLGYYRLDPASQVWALAPWAGDVLQGVVQVLAGTEARGSLNLVWLLAAAWLLHALARLAGLGPALAWLAVILMASLPLTATLMGGMQTELPATAGVLALALVIQRARQVDRAAALRLTALLAGFLLALKASMALPLAVLGAWLLWQWRDAFPWRALPSAIALGFLVGGSSYAYAWGLSGNPVLPLFNAWFGSPYFPDWNFSDPRYTGQFGGDILWRLVFETDRMIEGWRGSGGFQLVGLALLAPLALLGRRTLALAVAGATMLLALLLMAQYLRYAHPALVLLLVPMLVGLHYVPWRRTALAAGLALAALNFAYQSNANWMLRFGAVPMLIESGGDPQPLLLRFAPERTLLRDLHRHARVLFPGRPYHAELAGRGFSASWYDPELEAALHAARSGGAQTLKAFLQDYGFTHVLIGGALPQDGLVEDLRRIGASPLRTAYDATLWEVPLADDHPRRDLMRERDLATRLRRAWR